jgi:hypothetical protein
VNPRAVNDLDSGFGLRYDLRSLTIMIGEDIEDC